MAGGGVAVTVEAPGSASVPVVMVGPLAQADKANRAAASTTERRHGEGALRGILSTNRPCMPAIDERSTIGAAQASYVSPRPLRYPTRLLAPPTQEEW